MRCENNVWSREIVCARVRYYVGCGDDECVLIYICPPCMSVYVRACAYVHARMRATVCDCVHVCPRCMYTCVYTIVLVCVRARACVYYVSMHICAYT